MSSSSHLDSALGPSQAPAIARPKRNIKREAVDLLQEIKEADALRLLEEISLRIIRLLESVGKVPRE
jgi:hypothetical protein